MNRRTFFNVGVPLLTGALAVVVLIVVLLNPRSLVRTLTKNDANPAEPAQAFPPLGNVGQAMAFKSIEGKTGWRVGVTNQGPLLTPAVVDDRVLLGCGFATFEFRAFDAATGKTQWQLQTSDNGPSSAVVVDDRIVYNTESCKLEVVTTAGASVWNKWLGDPLLTTPAVADGRIYTSFPGRNGGGNYQLACLDLKDGAILWQKPIPTEIITSVTLDKDRLYFTTYDGKLWRCDRETGDVVWQDDVGAVSSPQIVGDRLYFQRRIKEGAAFDECLAWRSTGLKSGATNVAGTVRGQSSVESESRQKANDAGYYSTLDNKVGWADGALNFEDAKNNVGLSTASAVWSFQGSRPFLYEGKLYRSVGSVVQCVDPAQDKVIWTQDSPNAGQVTAPALANGKVFVGTTSGALVCLSAANGVPLWQATLGEPVSAQVAIARGRAFVSTRNGNLFSIETGDVNDHGWPMWGGNAGHDGKAAK